MDVNTVPRKLWEHPDPQSTAMYALMQEINNRHNIDLKTFHDLFSYSVTRRAQFWDQCFQFLRLIYSGSYSKVVDEDARMDSLPHWFEGVNINFAENILYTRGYGGSTSERGTKGKEANKIALVQIREGNTESKTITWAQLRTGVFELSSAMKEHGVKKGDRIAVVASNSFDTLKVFLAATSLGAIFTSSSTDMGVSGVLQRLIQVEPRYLFMDDTAVYNGKTLDLRQKITDIVNGMKGVAGFEGVVVVPRFQKPVSITNIPQAMTWAQFLSRSKSDRPFFETTAYRDPFLIAYSSGTTGIPKCIVHSIGGAMTSSAKEAILHSELGPQSVCLQYTTTGWIMYLASTLNLLIGAKLIMYDGSPFLPDATVLLQIAAQQKVTKLGVSPRWMQELQKNNIIPKKIVDLSHLKAVSSTGMVLSDQLFEWFYDVAFPPSAHLSNISGGTDLAGCFGLENPLTPVYVGGTQGGSLGTPVAIYDSLIEGGRGVRGSPVPDGTPGELVSPKAFPNMPPMFWNDVGGKRYFGAYFEKYDDVWVQGDFAVIHPITKCITFLGRADGVLNPSGIRFGSAEIYSVLEQGFPQLQDTICVGQRRPQDMDESVMLFCLMKPGEKFSEKLANEIRAAIRKGLSPRHVPKYIFETPDIPTTVNLKKVELPVKQIVSGMNVKPSGTLLNPDSLKFYYKFAKVEDLLQLKSKL